MKNKIWKYGVFIISVMIIIMFLGVDKLSTVRQRESYLGKIDSLGEIHIESELVIDDYIISAYTGLNGNYGLAIFEPIQGGNYKFQSNINKNDGEVIFTTIIINKVVYDIFWANKRDLDYAQISYVNNDGIQNYKIDASNNKIIYIQNPKKNYEVSAKFITKNGEIYR